MLRTAPRTVRKRAEFLGGLAAPRLRPGTRWPGPASRASVRRRSLLQSSGPQRCLVDPARCQPGYDRRSSYRCGMHRRWTGRRRRAAASAGAEPILCSQPHGSPEGGGLEVEVVLNLAAGPRHVFLRLTLRGTCSLVALFVAVLIMSSRRRHLQSGN